MAAFQFQIVNVLCLQIITGANFQEAKDYSMYRRKNGIAYWHSRLTDRMYLSLA